MDEKKEKQGTSKDDGKGDKYETTPIIERAREEREKLEAANTKKEELLKREEQIMARKELGGMSEAGQQPKKAEETDDEYAARFERGEVNPLKDDGAV